MDSENAADALIGNIEVALRERNVDSALALWQALWDSGCRDKYVWMNVFNLFDRHNLSGRIFPNFMIVALEIGIENDWMPALLARAACHSGAHEAAIALCNHIMERAKSGGMKFLLLQYLYTSHAALGHFDAAIEVFLSFFAWRPLASSGDLPVQFTEVAKLCKRHGRPDWANDFRQDRVPAELDLAAGPGLALADGLEGAIIRHTVPATQQNFTPPRSINNIWPLESCFAQAERHDVNLYELKNAFIIGNLASFVILSEDGAVVEQLSNAYSNARAHAGIKALLDAQGEIAEIETVAVIRDKFTAPNICHFLFDQISRLALFEAAGIDYTRLAIIGPDMGAGFQSDILAMLGIAPEHFLSTEGVWSYRCRRLLIPDNVNRLQHPAHLGDRWALDFLRKSFAPRDPAGPALRLYVSRETANGRRIRNEPEIRALLEKFGFQTVYSEKLSFADQAALFARASHVIGPHGAGLTNIVFCAQGTKILEIFHPFYSTGSYFYITEPLGFDYRIACDATADPATYSPGRGYGYLDIMAPLAQIESWLEEVT